RFLSVTRLRRICGEEAYCFFEALFLPALRFAPPFLARLVDFFAALRPPRFAPFLARFADLRAPPRFAALRPPRFVAFFARLVDFFAARRLVALRPPRLDFFFGAAAGAVGVIIDIMSAIIVVSPV